MAIFAVSASMPRNVVPGLMPSSSADQRARADHLGQQVEDRHRDRGDGGGRAHRALAHPERQHVGHRVLARVAQQLRDQQQRHQPGDQEADRVEEAVVAVQRDDAGDAEERGGRHVVAADRHAVLEAGERPAAGVEVGRRLGLPAGPDRDGQGDRDEDQEQGDGQRAGGAAGRLSREDVGHRVSSPHLGLDPVGDRVELPVGVPGVEPGDQERRDELEQAEDQRHVDVADDLDAHEVARVGATGSRRARTRGRTRRSSGTRSRRSALRRPANSSDRCTARYRSSGVACAASVASVLMRVTTFAGRGWGFRAR